MTMGMSSCPGCGQPTEADSAFCRHCGRSLQSAVEQSAPADASSPHRALLDDLLPRYRALGYTVVERGPTTARLEREEPGGLFSRGPSMMIITLAVSGAGSVVGGRSQYICGRCGRLQGYWQFECGHCKAKYAEWPRLPA